MRLGKCRWRSAHNYQHGFRVAYCGSRAIVCICSTSYRLGVGISPGSRHTKARRLTPEIEAIITSVINECGLTKQKMTGEEVIAEVHRRCRIAKLDSSPCAGSIRARLRAIHPREKALKREGKKAAHDKFGAVKGSFPKRTALLANTTRSGRQNHRGFHP